MRHRIAWFLSAALLAAVVGIFLPASSASATGVCAGLGTATTGVPLSYPVVADPTATRVEVRQPVTGSFSFTFTPPSTCVNTTGTTTTVKGLSATGQVSGYCGLSSGTGVTSDGYRFAWVGIGGTLVVTGGLLGVVNAVPDALAGHSCNKLKPGGASRFLVNGAALKLHCPNSTATKVKRTTTVPVPVTLTKQGTTLGVHTGPMTVWAKLCVYSPIL